MAGASASRIAANAGDAVFEIERFAWTEPDRIEIAGHWSGVRGRRFMRPTLDVPGQRPLLALLEHKPWAPESDEWIAAFPWEGEPVDLAGAELAVSPDVVLVLPSPDVDGKTPAKQHFDREPEPEPVDPLEQLRAERDEARRERGDLRRERDELKRRVERLERERDEAVESALAEARSALERERGRFVGDARDAVERERARFAAERESLVAERDAAVEARDAAVLARDSGRGAVDAALQQRDAAVEDREAAYTDRDAALRERDAVVEERNAVRRERNALMSRVEWFEARGAGGGVTAETRAEPNDSARASEPAADRDVASEVLQRELDAIARERDAALRERDAAVRQRDTAIAQREVARATPLEHRSHDSRAVLWISRGLAITTLVFAVTLMAILLRAVF